MTLPVKESNATTNFSPITLFSFPDAAIWATKLVWCLRSRSLNLMLAGALLSVVIGGNASPVTLKDDELVALRSLITDDPDAAVIFKRIQRSATIALEAKPDPVIDIFAEGHLKSDPKNIRTRQALNDMQKIEALAWAGAVIGDERFNTKAREFILAWASVNKPDGNPINATKFEPLIEAYDLLRLSFGSTDRSKVDAWLRETANKLWSDERSRKDNFQSHRLKVIGLIASTIGDARLWRIAEEGFKVQISESFEPDGESDDFKKRDALHYHLYSVQPLLTLACVAERRNTPLFSYRAKNGASLAAAVDFLKPFVIGEKTHIEFAKSEVKFDKKRANAGEVEYAEHNFQPKSAIGTLTEAGCLNKKYDQLAIQANGTSNGLFPNWRSVLNKVITSSGKSTSTEFRVP